VNPLRLNRAQFGLAVLATALFVAAIAALFLSFGPPATPDLPGTASERPIVFEPPVYTVANDPESPLVERNPFDASRRAPARRRTTTASPEEQQAVLPDDATVPPPFNLLGTVVMPSGKNIAVLQTNALPPGGAPYHIGDEPLPGYRITAVARDRVTIVGGGSRFDLTFQTPATTANPETEPAGQNPLPGEQF